MQRVVLVGVAIWVVALVVLAVLWRAGVVGTTPLWSCVAGAALGLAWLGWEKARGRG